MKSPEAISGGGGSSRAGVREQCWSRSNGKGSPFSLDSKG